MIEQPRQRRKLPRATPSRAMIHRAPMHRAVHMLVQRLQPRKLPMADVALVPGAVPARGGDDRGARRGGRVGEELLGDDVIGVAAEDLAVEGVVVEGWGGGAGGGFEVGGEAGGGGEGAGAEGAGEGGAAVGFGVEVLGREKVLVEAVCLGLVHSAATYHAQIVFVLEALLAAIAPMVAPVVEFVHVGSSSLRCVEHGRAGLAFELWAVMAVVVHVILCVVFGPEGIATGVAAPVTEGIHVLAGGMPVDKLAVADVALGHL